MGGFNFIYRQGDLDLDNLLYGLRSHLSKVIGSANQDKN